MVKISASALTFAAAHVAVASAQDDCPKFDESSGLGSLAASVPILMTTIQGLPDPINQCLASIKMDDVMKLVGNDDCSSLITGLMSTGGDNKLAAIEELLTVEDLKGLKKYAEDSSEGFCTSMASINTCLTKGDNSAVSVLIAAVGGQTCCSGFKTMVDQALTTETDDAAASAAVEKVIAGLLFDVENIFCAKRAGYGDDSSKQMRCMSLMAQPFFGSAKDTQNLLKIPNNQALDAYEGKDFTNADNSSVSFPAAYDSCSWPMDTLMTGLKNLPLVSSPKQLGASNLFADGQCAPADAIQEKAGAIPLIGGYAKAVFTEGCYHFANGFSADAKFQNVATLTNGATSDGSSTGSDGSKKDNAGVLTSLSATVVVVAVAQFFL